MSIKVNGQNCKVYKGDNKPINLYRGSEKIAGWQEQNKVGESVQFDNSYDDEAEVSVYGNSEQVVTEQGKNLFSGLFSDLIENNSLVDLTIENNIVVSDTTAPTTTVTYYDKLINLESGQTYTITASPDSVFGHTIVCLALIPEDLSAVSVSNYYVSTDARILPRYSFTGTTTFTFTPTWTGNYRIGLYLAYNYPAFTVENPLFQLELGSTATAYEPFIPDSPSPDYPADINSIEGDLVSRGKNLFDYLSYGWSNLQNFGLTTIYRDITHLLIPGEAYTFSAVLKNNGFEYVRLRIDEFDSNDTVSYHMATSIVDGESGTSSLNSHILDPSTVRVLAVFQRGPESGRLTPGTADFSASDIQLELGSTATDYESYRTPTSITPPTLRKVGDVADTYNPKTGEYVKRIGEKIFDGSEDWVFGVTDANTTRFRYTPIGSLAVERAFRSTDTSIVSHFALDNDSYSRDIIAYTGSTGTSGLYIRVPNTIARTVEELKTWIADQYNAGTPVTVYYQLATPITTYLTPATVPTFPKTTVIEQDGEVKGTISATAKVVDLG